jgi:hypothetical protein
LEQVAEGRRWWSEFWGERQALTEIASALEWWDRYDFRSTTVRPQVAQVVRTVRRVREAVWSEVPF